MNRITFLLKLGIQGSPVADLQDTLQVLLDRGIILANDEAARRELAAALKPEREALTYRDVTAKGVSIFQGERNLQPSGEVDERTADALNALLREWGLLEQPDAQRSSVVSGQVSREDGLPFKGGLVRAFHEAEQGAIRLGEDTTDAGGRYTIRYEPLPGVAVVATPLSVEVYAADGRMLGTPTVIQAPRALETVDLVVPDTDLGAFQVEGRVASRASAGVGGLQVRLVDKGVGGDLLLAQTETASDGRYRVSYSDRPVRERGKQQPDVQVRLFRGETFLAASEVRYNATPHETLDVRLDDQAVPTLQSEHETLTTALRSHFSGALGDLEETEERQDITFLANKAGWDARAVALSALAERFSAGSVSPTGEAIEPAFFYALFRAGLPANDAALYRNDARVAQEIWERAITEGVIPAALEARLPAAVEAFQKQVARQALDGPPAVGLSSLEEMLEVSLSAESDPEARRAKAERFADLYTRHRDEGDQDAFWGEVQQSLGDVAPRLRLDGQFAFLTLNNAPLINKLRAGAGAEGLKELEALVAGGYYRPEKWQEDLSGTPIPPEIPGQDEAEKRRRYADFLAAQVRLSFPTLTVAQMVLDNQQTWFAHANGGSAQAATAVHAFLTEHQGRFELGAQPVEQYTRQNNVEIGPEVRQEITRIQRVYQITPGDQAMSALLSRKVDSAYKVVQYDQRAFVRAFRDEVGGEANARLIHARAQQVHNATLNIAVTYLNQVTAPAIGMHHGAQMINPAPSGLPGADVIAYPTLERLFGGMDFCACEHCRSMLSPAAYLVDLLHFLDRAAAVWSTFLSEWKADHGDAPYPFASLTEWQAAGSPADTEITPLQVLLARRPDIQHLPLTCENTNTPLPYIDLVNETLEHFVASGSLADYTGHTTDGSASPEKLLANPQFVVDEAYATLAGTKFPPPLPFNLPLETLRRLFDRFDAPMPEVMEAVRENDDLERAGDARYAWRDILMEALDLSREEYALLTESVPINGSPGVMGTLKKLYGFDAAIPDQDVLEVLGNAKRFARRVGISYELLVEILKTLCQPRLNPDSAPGAAGRLV